MTYEIEMLSLGNADSFIIKYINDKGKKFIILIDAGKKGDGPKILEHIKKYYTEGRIDLAISTHLDSDHIGGFEFIVKNITIAEFWIHDPRDYFDSKNIDKIIKEAIKVAELKPLTESIRQSKSLNELIDSYSNIQRIEPRPGLGHRNIPLTVLAPSRDYYKKLLKKFKDLESLNELSLVRIANSISENDKSPTNNSSLIILFETNENKHLFTGDASDEALRNAFSYYEETNETVLSKIFFLNVPHHGSIKNLSFNIIQQLSPCISFISANGDNEHPSQKIVSDLKSIGSIVYSTSHSGNTYLALDKLEEDGYPIAKSVKYSIDENDIFENYLSKSVFSR